MNFRNKHLFLCTILVLLPFAKMFGQELFPDNGPRNTVHNTIVFQNATIITAPGEVMKNATLVIRDERIVSVGIGTAIPKNAVVHDLKGKWIYPGFIDLDSDYGLPSSKPGGSGFQTQPQIESKIPGAYSWNEAVKANFRAVEQFHVSKNNAENLRKKGFGAVLSQSHDGIFRGTSAVVLTGDERDNLMVLKEDAAFHLSFFKGSSHQDYPTSLMGIIALIRQTYYDAIWYEGEQEKDLIDLSLEAMIQFKELPVFCAVPDYQSVLRADKLGDEFSKQLIIRGRGDEYQRVQEIKSTGATLIVPAKLPAAYKIENTYDVFDLSYEQLRHWELAPYNLRYLYEASVPFSLTSEELKPEEFWTSIRKFVESGLPKEELLRSLTTRPASLIGEQNNLGKIQSGYVANFLVTSGDLFDKDAVIFENWVNGKPYTIQEKRIDIRGEYNLNVGKDGLRHITVEGSLQKPTASFMEGEKKQNIELQYIGREITLKLPWTDDKEKFTLVLSGNINDEESRIWAGKTQLPTGAWIDWAAIRQKSHSAKDTNKLEIDSNKLPALIYPPVAYGVDTLPLPRAVLFKHATIWTSDSAGILKDADLCLLDGKIHTVGQNLSKAGLFGTKDVNLMVIECKGKHITAGLIDEHSHIAISRGVNEAGQAISSEVRIGDVVDADDINIYRQLSGGVTASQLLHGSANPIGGQSALIKLRWGYAPESMKIKDAVGFIKFALGENVKQSNWGDSKKIRYPQTRMGVEQVYYDAFIRAKEYKDVWKIYQEGLKSKKNKHQSPAVPHRDLELDALVEILDQQRFITCHSYVQSEITMLMRVADSMQFKINTFTHILEGYKVADKMKNHGVGASTFSDWWAYKFEVNDAIPYNAAILQKQGIVTAINSDDAEMGRRLNQEAAKTVKYGGVSEEEALKMVTINPAKLLHLDHRMGSIKVGKDGDVVLWTDHPLSINARAEQTYIDGRLFYDLKSDADRRLWVLNEKNRIVQKMMNESGDKKRKVERKEQKRYHCDTLEVEVGDVY